jgi:tripartite-type tricarboxylate transporter receptor subunit TctC
VPAARPHQVQPDPADRCLDPIARRCAARRSDRAESGIAGYDPQFWYGVFVPAATPKDVIAKLSDAVAQTVKDPGVMDALAKQGVVPASMTPAQFGEYVKADAARWGKVVADSGAKAD